jgi:multisubunit Na+/H+ antiporter MnhC subunit
MRRFRETFQHVGAILSGSPRLAAAVTLGVGAIPAFFMAWFVVRHGVNVPLQDDWEMAPLIVKAHTGALTFSDIFNQQQEARTVIPKLIFIASTWRGEWDVRDLMKLSVACCILTALGIYVLLRRARLPVALTALCFWAACALIFSPTQFELWLFASGFPSFVPALCLVAAWVVLGSGWSMRAKFSWCVLLAFVSTFTLAHGLLAWGLTLPVYLLTRREDGWKRALGFWALIGAACAAIYFAGYAKPRELPAFAPTVPLNDYAHFFLAFLGGPLALGNVAHPFPTALVVGVIVLALFAMMLVYVCVRWRHAALAERVAPFVALAFYSVCSAGLATLGRVGFGPRYALASRYVPFSLYLMVSLTILLCVVAGEMFVLERRPWVGRAAATIAAAVLLSGAMLHQPAFVRGVKILRNSAARYRLARTALLFSPVVDAPDLIASTLYSNVPSAIERARELSKAGLLRPPLVNANRVDQLAPNPARAGAVIGAFEALGTTDPAHVRASGWAVEKHERGPADAVLLAYQTPAESAPVLFAIADERVPRKDLKHTLHTNQALWGGWSVTFPRDVVPAGATISAWGVDADEPSLHRLAEGEAELKL